MQNRDGTRAIMHIFKKKWRVEYYNIYQVFSHCTITNFNALDKIFFGFI